MVAAKELTVDALPDWQQDTRVTSVQARITALTVQKDAHYAELKALQKARNPRPDLYESLPVPFPQGHAYYGIQTAYWQAEADLKTATTELMRTETHVKNDAAQAGYRVLARSWREELVPVLQHLVAALTAHAQVTATVKEKTGASVDGFGTVTLEAKALAEWIASTTARTFGSAGG